MNESITQTKDLIANLMVNLGSDINQSTSILKDMVNHQEITSFKIEKSQSSIYAYVKNDSSSFILGANPDLVGIEHNLTDKSFKKLDDINEYLSFINEYLGNKIDYLIDDTINTTYTNQNNIKHKM